MTISATPLSFFWQWRNATGPEKDAMCDALEVSRTHLSLVANGHREAKKVLRMALAQYLHCEESILFPEDCPSKRKHESSVHMVNQHTVGQRL